MLRKRLLFFLPSPSQRIYDPSAGRAISQGRGGRRTSRTVVPGVRRERFEGPVSTFAH